MQSHRTSVGLSRLNGCGEDEIKRRVTAVRERLRRDRATRRMAERAAPCATDFSAEASELEASVAGHTAWEEKS